MIRSNKVFSALMDSVSQEFFKLRSVETMIVPPMTAMKRNVKMTTQTKPISAPSLKSTTRLWSYIAKPDINHQKQKQQSR